MLMKIGNSENGTPDGIALWTTGLSWCDQGALHPITATIVYAVPHLEVVDVSLDYDKHALDIPSRTVEAITAAAIAEYLQQIPTLRQKHEAKPKRRNIDPLFED
jgi:hypothetical protein